jgi:hypothetical protein
MKLADRYFNSVTPQMHKKLGPRGWQRSKIDCQQLGLESRQPLIPKKYEIILNIFGGKIDLCKNCAEIR